jgi:hypothetical protein
VLRRIFGPKERGSNKVGYAVLITVVIKITVFCEVVPCSLEIVTIVSGNMLSPSSG